MEIDLAFTAAQIAADVRSGRRIPSDAVREALARIEKLDGQVGAFVHVRAAEALAEADKLAGRADLANLPLAGVPVAIKENLAVTGVPTRSGSRATSAEPPTSDHEVVARVRAAGAIVVGTTAMPELGIFGTTDSSTQITRNPWNPDRSAGGSSGGSAAAVAAGMVPIAVGNDGMGSVRLPAACCGVVGLKPGAGLVPAGVGVNDWLGMAENGPLATTVDDVALLASVLADRRELSGVRDIGKVRIGLAVGSPIAFLRVDRHWLAAARTAASVLVSAGHLVETTQLPYPANPLGMVARWTESVAADAEGLDAKLLQKRSRWHAALGRISRKIGLFKLDQVVALNAKLEEFFADYDVVLTPTLLQSPPAAERWSEKSWLANIWSNAKYGAFAPLWNFVGLPAASVPVGIHPVSKTPLAVQIAGPRGAEATILALAAQLEQRNPWVRTAPL